ADPKQRPSSIRPRVELEQTSPCAAGMVEDLARLQLRAALGVAAIVAKPLGALPLHDFVAPTRAALQVCCVPLAWLLLGVLPFPVLFGAGIYYSRIADYKENEFANTLNGP